MANTQRRFAVMGENTFRIANKLMSNQRICRLLKYHTRDPFLTIDPFNVYLAELVPFPVQI